MDECVVHKALDDYLSMNHGSYWKLHLALRIMVRNRIVPHMYLRVMACRWWNHELWLMAAKVILRLSSKDVERGWAW